MGYSNKLVVNSPKTLSRALDDPDFVAELYGAFLDTLGEKVEQVQYAIRAGEPKSIGAATHSLKGACSVIDAERLYHWAWKMEQAALQGDMAGVHMIAKELAGEEQAVKGAIREWLDGYSGKKD